MVTTKREMLICDLTQSYAPVGGGGVSTYLREKRRHILAYCVKMLLAFRKAGDLAV